MSSDPGLVRRLVQLEARVRELSDSLRFQFAPPFHTEQLPGIGTTVTIDENQAWFQIQNVSGQRLDQYAIVGLADPVRTAVGDDAAFVPPVIYESALPDATKSFAVLQLEGVVDGIVPAVMDGLSLARVSISTATDGWANCITADYEKLLAQATPGPAKIEDHDPPTAWSSATTYVAGDMVASVGIYYTCTLGHTNQVPPNGTYWSVGAVRWALVWLSGPAGSNLDAVIEITSTTPTNDSFGAFVESRDNTGKVWTDGAACWAIDLSGETSLTIGDRFPAIYVGTEASGPYSISIVAGNIGNALTDAAKWITLAGSITPSAWSGATAYVVGNLVTSGGNTYICISAHTNHVPPNATYWVLVSLADLGGYNAATTYGEGDYVQEIRSIFGFRSARGSIYSDVSVKGPDYIFAAVGYISIHKTVGVSNGITFDVAVDLATASLAGLVSTTTQEFGGLKTFNGGLRVKDGYIELNNTTTGPFGVTEYSRWFTVAGGGASFLGYGKDPHTNDTITSITLQGGDYNSGTATWVSHFGLSLYGSAGGIFDPQPSYRVYNGTSTLSGVWGTDSIGNVISGGIITTIGTAQLAAASGGTGSDLSGTGPGIVIQASSGAALTISQQSDIGALTDSSGGTADTTIQNIGAAYSQTEIANNFADLAAQVNAIRTALRACKLMA